MDKSVISLDDLNKAMGTLTKNSYTDMIDKKMSARECLHYLANTPNWNAFGYQLKDIYKKHYKENDIDDEKIIDVIGSKLYSIEKEIDPNYKQTEKYMKKRVKGWLNGVQPEREYIFEICFALELSAEESVELLSRGREEKKKGSPSFAGFNIKDVREAIIMYCLQNNRPYSDVDRILDRYDKASQKNDTEQDRDSSTYSLFYTLVDSDWEDDDLFLNNFLIPNKHNFTGASKTAVKNYCQLRRLLMAIVISFKVYDESSNDDSLYTVALFSALQKYYGDNNWKSILVDSDNYHPEKDLDSFRNYVATIGDDYNNNDRYINYLRPLINDCENGLTDETVCDEFLDSVFSSIQLDNKKENNSDITFSREILKSLLQDPYNYEETKSDSKIFYSIIRYLPKKPTNYGTYNEGATTFTDSFRNSLILLYFLDYIWSDTVEKERTFKDFYDDLSELLAYCGLPFLYPRYAFDFIIMYWANIYINSIHADKTDALDDVLDNISSILYNSLDEV